MVTVAEHQALLAECQQWLEDLKSLKVEMVDLKNDLYVQAAGKTEQELLKAVEHFHNQFHVQLINIHDLKHQIKHHIAEADHHPNFGHKVPHHQLELQLKNLKQLLADLLHDYRQHFPGS